MNKLSFFLRDDCCLVFVSFREGKPLNFPVDNFCCSSTFLDFLSGEIKGKKSGNSLQLMDSFVS